MSLELDELDRRLNLASHQAVADNGESDLLAGWQRIVNADAATPLPRPEFVRSLRSRLIAEVSAAQGPIPSSRTSGIVATPLGFERAHISAVKPHYAPRSFATVVAVAAAILFALVMWDRPWSDGDQHGFGFPTARASSTAIVATATVTPTVAATIAGAIGPQTAN
jgi:hypothetical protein